MATIRESLKAILVACDYTQSCCEPGACIGLVLPEETLNAANRALEQDAVESPPRTALLLLLAALDYTVPRSACAQADGVSSVLTDETIGIGWLALSQEAAPEEEEVEEEEEEEE